MTARQKKRTTWRLYNKARIIEAARKLSLLGATTPVICRILKVESAHRIVSGVIREIYVDQLLRKEDDFYLCKRRRSTWSEAWFMREPERMIECNYLLKIYSDTERELGTTQDQFELADRLEAVYRTYLDLTHNDVASAKIPFIRFYDALRLQTARRLIFRRCKSCHHDYLDRATTSRSVCYVCARLAVILQGMNGCPACLEDHVHKAV